MSRADQLLVAWDGAAQRGALLAMNSLVEEHAENRAVNPWVLLSAIASGMSAIQEVEIASALAGLCATEQHCGESR